jgi:two-component system NarL family response regulator
MSGEAFIEALRGLEQGIPPFSPGLAAKLLDEFARLAGEEKGAETRGHGDTQKGKEAKTRGRGAAEAGSELTERQTEVLRLVADGLTYREVGEQLSLSERTVRFHMSEIIARLHLYNRSQVLAYVGKHGLT